MNQQNSIAIQFFCDLGVGSKFRGKLPRSRAGAGVNLGWDSNIKPEQHNSLFLSLNIFPFLDNKKQLILHHRRGFTVTS